MRVISIAGHPDWPVPLEMFLANGKYQEDYVALIHYDEICFIITALADCLVPFQLPDAIPNSQQEEETILIPVKVGDLRKVQAILKNVPLKNG